MHIPQVRLWNLAGGALCMALFMASPALAQTTKWVDQESGSDLNDGDTAGTAYATLQHAIDSSDDGTAGAPSIIYVANGAYESGRQKGCGNYAASLVIRERSYLTVRALPGHEPAARPFPGPGSRPGSSSDPGAVTSLSVVDSDHIVIDNLDLDQSLAKSDAMHVCGSSDVTVQNATIGGGEDGIDVETGHVGFVVRNNVFRDLLEDSVDFSDGSYQDIVIEDNLFEATNYRPIIVKPKPSSALIQRVTIRRNVVLGTTSEEAIRLIGVQDARIENNVVMNGQQEALYIDSGCARITVVHNTFFNDSQEGEDESYGEIRTKVTTSDIVIHNNILVGNGTNAVFNAGGATSLPGEGDNLYFREPAGSGFIFGAGSFSADPLFVSTTAGEEDLHLQPSSPAVAAAPDIGVTDDNEGHPRASPAGSTPDFGAYELQCSPTVPSPTTVDLAAFAAHNAFVCGDYASAKDIAGTIAVAFDFTASGFSVGRFAAGTVAAVIGRDALTHSGTFYGDVVVGGSDDQADQTVDLQRGGAWVAGYPIDFARRCSELGTDSLMLSGALESAGDSVETALWGTISVKATGGGTRVFALDADDVAAPATFEIDAPADATVVINVTGAQVVMGRGEFHFAGGAAAERVLLNFPEATLLKISAMAVGASVLAPFAEVQAYNGNLTGSLMAGDVTGDIELHLPGFQGEAVVDAICP